MGPSQELQHAEDQLAELNGSDSSRAAVPVKCKEEPTEDYRQRLVAAGRKEVDSQASQWNTQKWQFWSDAVLAKWGQHMVIDLDEESEATMTYITFFAIL